MVRWQDVLRDPGRFYWPRRRFERLVEEAGPIAWYSSSQDFERTQGIHGVAGHYILPHGTTRADVEGLLHQQGHFFTIHRDMEKGGLPPFARTRKLHQEGQKKLASMLDIIDRTTTLNPDLDNIAFDRTNRQQVTEALAGIYFDFNPNDIGYYVNRNRNPNYMDVDWKESLSRCLDATEVKSLGWVPSPETLKHILAEKSTSLHESPVNREQRTFRTLVETSRTKEQERFL